MTLNDPYVTKHLCNLYVKYIVLPIGMTSNNIIFLCSPHYKDCLRTELGIDNSLCNPIYITTTLSKEEILDNHMSVLLLLGNFIQRLRTRYPFTLLDTSIKTMFGSALPPDVCRRAHVLFTSYLCLFAIV